MLSHRAFRFRLYASREQQRQFRHFSGVTRLVYNLALEQRERHWEAYRRAHGRNVSFPSQCRELTKLRAEFEFIREVSLICQQQALKDLDGAYRRFFSGAGGYPTPRKRGRNDSFRFTGRDCKFERVNDKWGEAILPKLGRVRFRMSRDIVGKIVSVTIAYDPLGWHVSFTCEVDLSTQPAPDNAIGIDRGVAVAIATSDGELQPMPIERLRILDRRIRKQQRALARCKKGSNRRRSVAKLISRNKAKQARIRKHFNHVQTKGIACRANIVVLEDLRASKMTKSAKGTIAEPGKNVSAKAGLNRGILNNNWHQFETFLSYKLKERGGLIIKINPAYTSQTCAECGSVNKTHRKSQAVFKCSDCGHCTNADTNAAKNILRAGTRPTIANAAQVA